MTKRLLTYRSKSRLAFFAKTLLLSSCCLALAQSSAQAQLWPHTRTFGFDYGFPTDAAELKWLATHHDVVVGAGDFQTKKLTEAQYDALKAANPDVIIIPYVVIQAFTFKPMNDLMHNWAVSHAHDSEDLYLHYYKNTVVETRTKATKTSATGTPSDRVCDENGTLLNDGEKGNHYLSLGYGGGDAATLAEARIYQFWNSGFKPRMNHLSEAWKGAYQAYALDVSTVTNTTDKFTDGLMLDTYPGTVDLDGYLPDMNNIIEVRDAGYGADDTAARTWYAEQLALYLGELRTFLATATGKKDIYLVPNFGELSYTYGSYDFGCADQFAPDKLTAGAIEYAAAPSKDYFVIRDYFRRHYEATEAGFISFNHVDTSWYQLGGTPPLGGKQFMIGSLYLLQNANTFSALHYGTPAAYGPKPTFSKSHWDPMLEYDIGTPVVRADNDFWDTPNTDRMYLMEYEAPGPYDKNLGRTEPRGRYVLAREFTKALVIVRYEKSDNNKLDELGTLPRTYALDGTYHRLLEDATLGPAITEVTLGLSEGAILIKQSASDGGPSGSDGSADGGPMDDATVAPTDTSVDGSVDSSVDGGGSSTVSDGCSCDSLGAPKATGTLVSLLLLALLVIQFRRRRPTLTS